MALTAAEQYMLEMINRARLDPAAEARRFGIDLNEGLAAGTISGAAKQVLAPNALLETAATRHVQWMFDTDTVSHYGAGGSTWFQRAENVGYRPTWIGEDIAWQGTTGPVNLASYVEPQHQGLFLSASHRAVMMASNAREIGLVQETGQLAINGVNYNSSLINQLYGLSGTAKFVTGVVYDDTDGDRFYSMGEGRSGAVFTVGQTSGTAQDAGGYAVAVASSLASSRTEVTGTSGGLTFHVLVDLGPGNAKLDLINGDMLATSASMTLVDGIRQAQLLGVANLKLTGNDAGNVLTGNSGANVLDGLKGNDRLYGKLGADNLNGGNGADRLEGGYGADTLAGGTGADLMIGGPGSDRFIFRDGFGSDRIADFTAGSDRLQLGHGNWSGALSAEQVVSRFAHVTSAGVSFDFDATDHLLLVGLTSTAGLAAAIDII